MTAQRPQYGELATPEEQRRAAGLPPLDEQLQAVPAGVVPPVDAAAVGPAASTPPESTSGNRIDRFATIALLVYGLIDVAARGFSYLDPSRVMNQAMEIVGVDGEFTNFEQGKLWGTIAAIVLAIGWALTALLSVRRLRRGKITWWLPVVGAVVTGALVSICFTVIMLGDPAFIEHMQRIAGS